MTTLLAITDDIKTLGQVETKLGITLSEDADFFTEWLAAKGELAETDRHRLDQVRRNYLYQSSDGTLLEETIKMVILSPLLELAGFYQAPYKFRAEVSVEVTALGDHDEILRGRIEALVLQEQLWVILIEAQKTIFDLELALPQTLTYMAANPRPGQPLCGLITNGSSYQFIKLGDHQYSVSDSFSTRWSTTDRRSSAPRNNLYNVLQILRHLGQTLELQAT
jgi:hypothetical protein